MDPKMDSGCVKSADDLEELYDVSRPLLPEEVLGVIDQLLCHEVSLSHYLITGLVLIFLDGVAPGISPLTDSVHQRLRRGPPYANANQYGRSPVCSKRAK